MIDNRKNIEAIITAKWNSQIMEHEENYFCKIDDLRELNSFPKKFSEQFVLKKEGESFSIPFKSGELFDYSTDNITTLAESKFSPPTKFRNKKPLLGRFYPLWFFKGVTKIISSNIRPVRVIGIKEGLSEISIDTNVPISRYDVTLNVSIERIISKSVDTNDEYKNWLSILLENGPGMQVRFNNTPTDFEFNNFESFQRDNEEDDSIFYDKPRLTAHIDSKCHENLVKTYERILPPSGKILDLMSSYQSHIPTEREYYVIGLGLNAEEMKNNKTLNEFIVHDLNKNPCLPFEKEEFDIIICDLGIEYVTKPFKLISEIKRVLKTKGIVTFSFSNRYFPPKVIKLWIDLHEFERLGYVLELLLRNGGFQNFKTFSYRGYDRPKDDKYFGYTFLSDPLYIVCASKE